MNILKLAIPVIMAFSLFLNTGCAPVVVGAAAGAGAVAYSMGELRATDEVSLDRAWFAAQQAVNDMQFEIVETEKDVVDAQLVALGAVDKRITITLHSIAPELTEVRVRVGILGDESLSYRILENMRNYYTP